MDYISWQYEEIRKWKVFRSYKIYGIVSVETLYQLQWPIYKLFFHCFKGIMN